MGIPNCCSQRNKDETIISVIKRLFGEHITSRLVKTQNRELSFRCIAYNIHRLTNLIVMSVFYRANVDTYLYYTTIIIEDPTCGIEIKQTDEKIWLHSIRYGISSCDQNITFRDQNISISLFIFLESSTLLSYLFSDSRLELSVKAPSIMPHISQ